MKLTLIPFILTPMINVSIAYFVTKVGMVPAATIAAPWTTPPIINGFLVTQSWRGAVLSIVLIVVAVCIYLPFVAMANKAAKTGKTKGSHTETSTKVRV